MLEVAREFFRTLFARSRRAAKGHPVLMAVSVAVAAMWSVALHASTLAVEEMAVATGVAAALVGFAVVAFAFLHQTGVITTRARIGLSAVALIAGATYGAWFYAADVTSEVWRWLLLVVGFACGLAAVPLGADNTDAGREVRFWRYNTRLVVRIAVCAAYLLLLYIGLCLGLLALDALFSGIVDERWYLHIGGWLFFVGGPWMVVAASRDIVDFDRPIDDAAITWIARIGSYLLVPLLALYLVITYAYAVRIVVTDFAPSNLVSPLVLGAGLLGFLGMYLVEPLRDGDDYGLLSRLFQFFPVALLAVLPLSVWAVVERVAQYGWTEFRYVRLLAIVLFALLCVYSGAQLIRRKAMALSVIPIVFGLGAMLASMGPWSMVDVSRASQLERMEAVLAEADIWQADDTVDIDGIYALDSDQQVEIGELTFYLRRHHGPETLVDWMPDDFDESLDGMLVMEQYRHSWYPRDDDGSAVHYVELYSEAHWRLEAGGTMREISYRQFEGRVSDEIELGYDNPSQLRISERDLTIFGEHPTWTVDIGELVQLAEEARQTPQRSMTIPVELRTIDVLDVSGDTAGSILVEGFNSSFDAQGEMSVEWLDGYLLLFDK